jgi:hypothetical protein
MPMSEKRARADAVIETQHGMEPARQQLVAILEQLRAGPVENSRKRTGPNATGEAET